MSFDPREYLRHIQVEVEYLLGSCAGLKLEEFLANETLRRAAVRSLEIIGEAAKKVPEEFRKNYPASSGARCPVCEIVLFTTISAWIMSLSGT